MIVTVLGPVEASSITGACSPHEHLLYTKPKPASGAPSGRAAAQPEVAVDITLANLAEVRSNPKRFAASNGLHSVDETVQELQQLVSAGGALVMECTKVGDGGRHPAGLVEVANRCGLHIVMGASCLKTDGAAEQGHPSVETIGRDFEHQLLLGDQAPAEAAREARANTSTTTSTRSARVQSGFILVNVEEPLRNAHIILEGAAWAQQKTGASLVITFPELFPWNHIQAAVKAAVSSSLESSASEPKTNRNVVLTGMHGGAASQPLGDQVEFLRQGLVLCFDCFGRVEWHAGPDYFPSEEESAVRIAELVKLGFAGQIVISQRVSRRVHLSRCGGFGYGHVLRTVPARLRRLGVSLDDIAAITTANTRRLLDWYTPPPPPEIPKDYLPCSWCGTRFEPVEGEYFHKFQFVYCGIKCLRAHRDGGFKELGDREGKTSTR